MLEGLVKKVYVAVAMFGLFGVAFAAKVFSACQAISPGLKQDFMLPPVPALLSLHRASYDRPLLAPWPHQYAFQRQ